MSVSPLPLAVSDDRAEAEAAANAKAAADELRRFVRNLVALIFVGVAISWWLIERTDFFPKVGGFFGLAGIFAWIAFLANLVPKKRKEELQDELEKRVLLRPTTATYALLVLIAASVWAAMHGTLEMSATGDAKRSIEIRDGATVVDTVDVKPGSPVKILLWTPRGTRNFLVRTSGLPPLAVTLKSVSRTNIVAPQSFMVQPVLLAKLAAEDVAAAAHGSVVVELQRGQEPWIVYDTIGVDQYNGESIWIGAAADTELPANLRDRWAADFVRQPKGVGADQPLQAGDVIRVKVKNQGGHMAAFGEAKVLPNEQRPFPQEIRLKLQTEEPR
jgi:hypothetical protein